MSGAEAGCMEAASHNWLLSELWHEGSAWPRWGQGSMWLLGVVSVHVLLWLNSASLGVFES